MLGKPFKPMLAMTVNNPQDNVFVWLKEEVALEPKVDGVRMQMHKQGNDILMFSRFGNDLTDKLPELVQSARRFSYDQVILDGELVCLNKDGLFDFYDVIRKLKGGEGIPIYFVFDVLYVDEKVYDYPFLMRRELLEKMFAGTHSNIRLMPQWITNDVRELMKLYIAMIKKGLEGLIIKDLEAPYYFNRTWYMKKLKPIKTMDLKIVNVTKGEIGYYIYDVAAAEGVVGKITLKGDVLKVGEIVECRFDKFIPSDEYPLGMSLRFATFVRKSLKKEPDSVGDYVAKRVNL